MLFVLAKWYAIEHVFKFNATAVLSCNLQNLMILRIQMGVVFILLVCVALFALLSHEASTNDAILLLEREMSWIKYEERCIDVVKCKRWVWINKV